MLYSYPRTASARQDGNIAQTRGTENDMGQILEAPQQMEQTRSQEPQVYLSGDCWRFSWAGEDRGSFDTEHDAKAAALRFKKQTVMKLVASSLKLR
jgi:hypothetical protein